MENMIVIKTSGMQRTKLEVAPTPFDFERSVLAGGGMDHRLMRTLVNLCFSEMFPPPKGNALFDWKSIMPHHLITYVSMFNILNKTMNSGAVAEGRPILPIQDSKLIERVNITGMLSPKEIESKFGGPSLKAPTI